VLFDDLHPGPIPTGAAFDRRASDRRSSAAEAATHPPLDPAIPAAIDHGPGLWDLQPADPNGTGAPISVADPDTLFHAARVALDRGQTAAAATGLILALRSAPRLAPAVLDLLSGRAEPILVLVRGDAQRIVGREAEAMRDHASAASRLAEIEAPPASPSQAVLESSAPAETPGAEPEPGTDEPTPEPVTTDAESQPPDQEDS